MSERITTDEMRLAIDIAADGIERALPHRQRTLRHVRDLRAARDYIGTVSQVVGERCPIPTCGHFLKAEHSECEDADKSEYYFCDICARLRNGIVCRVTADQLRAFPDIAKSLGLEVEYV